MRVPALRVPRKILRPYPDGTPKWEYRCRSNRDYGPRACGRNYIEGRIAEAAVHTAVAARLSDPRHATALAAHSAELTDERARVEGEISGWETQADQLADKTALWGVDRVDRAMAPILRALDGLRAELAELDDPATQPGTATMGSAGGDAVTAWETAVTDADRAPTARFCAAPSPT